MNAEPWTKQANNRLAFVFPGQGAQYVGMGRDLYDNYPTAKRIFEEADTTLGFPLSKLCFEGPASELTDTVNTQPAILSMSAACLAVLKEKTGQKLTPAFVAGHSLGEYTALLAAGVLDFATTLRLVRERGRVMKMAGQTQPGAMAAVLGLDAASLQTICDEVGDVWVANYNSPGQIVLSGRKPALERALQLARIKGAKRAILLAVSIAAHSPLMSSAAESFAETVNGLSLSKASIPIVANTTALPLTEPEDIRQELVRQLTSPVHWVESVHYMVAQGIRWVVEIGPKSVLSRLIKRIDPHVQTVNVGSTADIEVWGQT